MFGMACSEKEQRRKAKSFAEETAFVLLWELHRRRRAARQSNDIAKANRIDATIRQTKEQRQAMRKITSAASIRACADEWQETLGALDMLC